jgi:putative DNA primase/helicase
MQPELFTSRVHDGDVIGYTTNADMAAPADDANTMAIANAVMAKADGLMTQPESIDKLGSADTKVEAIIVTEDDLASMFVETYGADVRYVIDASRWLKWDGVCWSDGASSVAHDMRCLARNMSIGVKQTDKKALGKHSTAKGALGFVKDDPMICTRIGTFDSNKMLLGTPGGTVDLTTGQLRPAMREDFITRLAGTTPSETADCPKWLSFLHDATRGDVELIHFLQQMSGYFLTGMTSEHALFFVYGSGGNGKSVFLSVLHAALGDYAVTAPMSSFTASKTDQHPTDMAGFRGARLVTANETEEGKSWSEQKLKQLTGGDPVSARFMRQDFFEYLPQFKLIVAGNHKPRLRNPDEAMRRRFNLIPFTNRPEEPNRNLVEELHEELLGIMRWMIDGCLDWQRHGLVRPDIVLAETEEYFATQDTFAQWLEDRCVCKIGDSRMATPTETLFKNWEDYCGDRGEYVGNITRFGEQLTSRNFGKDRRMINGVRSMVRLGIALKADPNTAPPPDDDFFGP